MKVKEFINKYIPFSALILFGIMLICAIIHIFAVIFSGFADFFNQTVAAFFRFVLAKLSGVFPFSLTEIAIMFLPLIIALIIFFAIRSFRRNKEAGIRFLVVFLAAITLFYSSFVLTFACGYRGKPLEDKLALERAKVSKEELDYTARTVLSELNELSEKMTYGDDDFSVMPYDFKELNDKLNVAYEKGAEKYPFLQDMKSKVKPVILSVPMTYTHISGVYTYFSGEANVNTNFPDYNLPYTMAHEMAHQRGIAPENEANFIAYLICLESEDEYIRYSAYLNMFEYLSNALYRADKDAYKELIKEVNSDIIDELIAYSEFFEKYEDNVVADVSGAVNDSYLQSQGQTAGTKSYGLVVDLAVAYYKR